MTRTSSDNLFGLSQFIVATTAARGSYTLIQDAINDAAPGASITDQKVIWIKPGVYTENLTLAPFVHLKGACDDGRGQTVTIDGQVSIPSAFTFIDNLYFSNTAGGHVFVSSGAPTGAVLFSGCGVTALAGFACMNLTGGGGQLSIFARASAFSSGSAGFALTNNVRLNLNEDCSALSGGISPAIGALGNCQVTVTNATVNGGIVGANTANIKAFWSRINGGIAVTDTAVVQSINCFFTGTISALIFGAATASAIYVNNAIFTTSASTNWADGAFAASLSTVGNALMGTDVNIDPAILITSYPTA
jgi:pectin methylesterase-like acyl-CoA thioesterase